MPQFFRRRRGVLVVQDEQPLGLAPHGLSSDDALAAIGYRLDADGRAVPVTRAAERTANATRVRRVAALPALLQLREDDLHELTVARLRVRAKEAGIAGASRLSKADLVKAIAAAEVTK